MQLLDNFSCSPLGTCFLFNHFVLRRHELGHKNEPETENSCRYRYT